MQLLVWMYELMLPTVVPDSIDRDPFRNEPSSVFPGGEFFCGHFELVPVNDKEYRAGWPYICCLQVKSKPFFDSPAGILLAWAGPLPKSPDLGYPGCLIRNYGHHEYFASPGAVTLRGLPNDISRKDDAWKFERLLLSSSPPGMIPPSVFEVW